MKAILRYFVQGLLYLVPISITVLVVYKVFDYFASLFSRFGVIVNPAADPFIVLGAVILFILFVGFLGSTILRGVFVVLEHGIEKAPLLKIIYSSIKDFLSAFVGSKKRFNRPVLITINKENCIEQLGFITNEDLGHLHIKNKVAVYVPMSYSISGNLIIVPSDSVRPVDVNAADAMKFIVSGGVSEIE